MEVQFTTCLYSDLRVIHLCAMTSTSMIVSGSVAISVGSVMVNSSLQTTGGRSIEMGLPETILVVVVVVLVVGVIVVLLVTLTMTNPHYYYYYYYYYY